MKRNQTKAASNSNSNSLIDLVSDRLLKFMFGATPGMNVLVGSMIRVPKK